MKNEILTFLLLAPLIVMTQEIQKPISGKIHHLDAFQSEWVTPRNIDIWLPENYDGKKEFAVLYMHDGQMLYDSTTTWNHQTWDVDDIVENLIKKEKVKNFIIVGISNAGAKRHHNYFPQKPFDNLSNTEKDTVSNQLQRAGRSAGDFQPNSDNYLKFIVTELKPVIDQKYAVYTDRENTFIAGSSMGGLISIYAICEYPEVFGAAACMSTHWPGTFTMDNNPVPDAFISYLQTSLPDPADHKIYFDYGDQTLDAFYPPLQKRVDELMILKGYNEKNWKTQFFKGKDHSEKSWNERFEIPLIFLLGR